MKTHSPYRKGHDLEFMVSLETHAKVLPWKIDIQICVVVGLCSCTLNQMICHCHRKLKPTLLCHNKIVVYEGLWNFDVSWSSCFVLEWLLSCSEIDAKYSRPWDLVHCIPKWYIQRRHTNTSKETILSQKSLDYMWAKEMTTGFNK